MGTALSSWFIGEQIGNGTTDAFPVSYAVARGRIRTCIPQFRSSPHLHHRRLNFTTSDHWFRFLFPLFALETGQPSWFDQDRELFHLFVRRPVLVRVIRAFSHLERHTTEHSEIAEHQLLIQTKAPLHVDPYACHA